MSRKTEVPITPAILAWAIAESGLSLTQVGEAADVDGSLIRAWLDDRVRPGLTEMRHVAKVLHRQLATFLLPVPPAVEPVRVQFRHPIGAARVRGLNADERRFLRRARRLQEAQAWLVPELGRTPAEIEPVSLSRPPSEAAHAWRDRLGVSIDAQLAWGSASTAFDAWRAALEGQGITVVLFAMGTEACRGFSLWHESAPLIAVNTAWLDEARIFTLFHELGHLVTRTDSACAAEPVASNAGDPTERWCEAFAATVVIPASELTSLDTVDNLRTLSRIARRYKVSLRATALRLIELRKASWELYRAIPRTSDDKRRGGPPGTGRNRTEIRQDELGARTTDLFVSAVQRDLMSESQALGYLDIPSTDFERLAATAR